jgi:hypothetical protein
LQRKSPSLKRDFPHALLLSPLQNFPYVIYFLLYPKLCLETKALLPLRILQLLLAEQRKMEHKPSSDSLITLPLIPKGNLPLLAVRSFFQKNSLELVKLLFGKVG